MLPNPTPYPTKEHFRRVNPRCQVRDIDAGIWIVPPYKMYDESFRQYMNSLGAKWDGELQWKIAPRSVQEQQQLTQEIVEKAFSLGWDVEAETFHGGLSPLREDSPGGWNLANAVWYEHSEDYHA